MKEILGFSGKKQSGKNTSANIIAGTVLSQLGFATMVDNKSGQLYMVDDNGKWKLLDLTCRMGEPFEWLEQEIHPYIKLYSFADPLKEFCINIFGVGREQCYGTDEQKNSPTKLKWLNFKKFLPSKKKQEIQDGNLWRSFMSARDIMQVFGTETIREIYNDGWLNGTLNKIKQDQPELAIITDVRFENEVLGIQEVGGKVIRLTRNPKPGDEHLSELALDNFKDFDAFLHNDTDSIEEQARKLTEILVKFYKR